MSVRVNKTITVNNTEIELTDLIDHPWAFMDLLRTQFSTSTFEKKDSETYENYLKRLFALLFYRQNKVRQPRRISTTHQERKPGELAFEVVKHNQKTSRILFKESGHTYRINNVILDSLVESAKAKMNRKLNLKDKRIGVELEFLGDSSQIMDFEAKLRKLVGRDRLIAPMRYYDNDGSKWVLGTDGSLHSRRDDGDNYNEYVTGYELTSPILNLSSAKDLKELAKVCELIKTVMHGYTNRTCGTHVHMSFPVDRRDMVYTYNTLRECEFLCHFVRSYRNSEASLFDRLVPLSRRENRGRYCKTASVSYMDKRFRKLNVTNYRAGSDYLHLEFRQLAGTLDSNTIILWAKLQSLFVDSAMDKWKESKKSSTQPELDKLKLEDIIVSDIFKNDESVEGLMKMAKMIA